MNRFSKRIVSICMIMVLTLAMSFPALAATITPETGTSTLYLRQKSGTSTVYVDLAYGSKSFSIKRSDVKVTPGTTGAKLTGFSAYKSNSNYENYYSGKWGSSKYASWSYSADLSVSKPGTAVVAYKIGTKTYKRKVKVLAYTNPANLVTLTGVNGGKNIASLTKTQAYASKNLTFSASKKNVKLSAKAASGWKVTNMSLRDYTTGSEYSLGNWSKGFASGSMICGDLVNTHRYSISITFTNTKTKASISCDYNVNGSKAK